jgi:hypothetical protein
LRWYALCFSPPSLPCSARVFRSCWLLSFAFLAGHANAGISSCSVWPSMCLQGRSFWLLCLSLQGLPLFEACLSDCCVCVAQ